MNTDYTWLNEYIGIPWGELNCWALVRSVYDERLGIKLPMYADVDPKNLRLVSRLMLTERSKLWDEVPREKLKDFDVVLMRGKVKDDVTGKEYWAPTHCGVLVHAARRVLHTQVAYSSVHVDLDHPSVKHRIVNFFRYNQRHADNLGF